MNKETRYQHGAHENHLELNRPPKADIKHHHLNQVYEKESGTSPPSNRCIYFVVLNWNLCLPVPCSTISLSSGLTLRDMRKQMTLGGGRRAKEGPSKPQPPLCFTALQHLQISHCDALRELPDWLGGLVSLQYLPLDHCINLMTLPEGLEFLTALQKVFIWRCPFLKYRGVFDHVPDVTIIIWEETHFVLQSGGAYQDIIADTEELDSNNAQVIVIETKMDRSAGSCTNLLIRFCLDCTKGCSR